MARWTFEDYANGAMAVVGVALLVNSVYQAQLVAKRENDRRRAERWIDEATARIRAMTNHMQRNGASKECWKEALTAAKNVLAYEVREELDPNNFHLHKAEQQILTWVDRLIAEAK